jgi:hypothetical protein
MDRNAINDRYRAEVIDNQIDVGAALVGAEVERVDGLGIRNGADWNSK